MVGNTKEEVQHRASRVACPFSLFTNSSIQVFKALLAQWIKRYSSPKCISTQMKVGELVWLNTCFWLRGRPSLSYLFIRWLDPSLYDLIALTLVLIEAAKEQSILVRRTGDVHIIKSYALLYFLILVFFWDIGIVSINKTTAMDFDSRSLLLFSTPQHVTGRYDVATSAIRFFSVIRRNNNLQNCLPTGYNGQEWQWRLA